MPTMGSKAGGPAAPAAPPALLPPSFLLAHAEGDGVSTTLSGTIAAIVFGPPSLSSSEADHPPLPSGSGGTRFRGFYKEDPMMALPKWLLSWLMDKMMPSSLGAMSLSAVAYEKRLNEKRSARAAPYEKEL